MNNKQIEEIFEEQIRLGGHSSLKSAFISEYCNNHDKLRWLRGIFFDEEEQLNTMISWLEFADWKLTQVHNSAIDRCVDEMGEEKETWDYAGGGGIDTEHWCKKGICFCIPGIKQIVSYGIKNEIWWIKYFLKWQVILPEKYKDEGYNFHISISKQKLEKLKIK